jgi:hypothetical protein
MTEDNANDQLKEYIKAQKEKKNKLDLQKKNNINKEEEKPLEIFNWKGSLQKVNQYDEVVPK